MFDLISRSPSVLFGSDLRARSSVNADKKRQKKEKHICCNISTRPTWSVIFIVTNSLREQNCRFKLRLLAGLGLGTFCPPQKKKELEEVAVEREVWAALLRLRPGQDERKKMDRWMGECVNVYVLFLECVLVCMC